MTTPNEPPSAQVEHTHSVQRRRSRRADKTPDKMVGSPVPHAGDLAKMPENRAGEWALVIAKAAATLIPFAGGPAAEVLGAILQPQIEKRKTEWTEGIALGLDALSQRVDDLTPERLSQSLEFATAFMHASTVAMRTHQREKLEALRNAVLNVAAGTAPDDDTQLIFLNLLDALTPSHLRLLKLFVDPEKDGIQGGVSYLFHPMGSNWDIVLQRVPSLKGQRELYHFYVSDLVNRGLLTPADAMGGPVPVTEPLAQYPTGLAHEFLDFITSPIRELEQAGADNASGPHS